VRQTVLVALGGMAGCVARFWLSDVVQRLGATAFPIGTVVVNVAGSFALGLVVALTAGRGEAAIPIRALLGVGFCGGFTTMSTFALDTMVLARDATGAAAAGNVALTIALCLAAVWIGYALGRG
jgi:CrcB protein